MILKEIETDILFIVPPYLRFLNSENYVFPLGLGQIVSYLSARGISSKIYNADIFKPQKNYYLRFINFLRRIIFCSELINQDFLDGRNDFERNFKDMNNKIWLEVRHVLEVVKPKILGISCKSTDIESAEILAKLAKSILPEVKIVVGGPAANTYTEHFISNISFDYIIRGEGEIAMHQLTECIFKKLPLEDFKKINGLIFRQKSTIIKNEFTACKMGLDEIPFPDRESMFYLNENNQFEFVVKTNDIITSRGCPYHCKFCSSYVSWGTRKPKLRSIENIIEEIVYLHKKYGQKNFIIWDDLFTANKNRVIKFCEKILESSLEIKWLCFARINTIDEELIAIMKKAGCIEIQVGIESGNNRILKHIKKDIDLEMIYKKSKIINDSGMKWTAFFIIGFPGETKKEILDTIKIIPRIKPTAATMSIFAPYAGTDFYFELVQSGQMSSDYERVDCMTSTKNYTGTMSDRDFKKIAVYALEKTDKYNFYLKWSYNFTKLVNWIFRK